MRTIGCCANATPATVVEEGWVCTMRRVAVAGLAVKKLLTTGVSAPVEALNVFDPDRSTLRFAKVARPLASVVCAVAPPRVPEPFSVILTTAPGTLLLNPSVARTVTAGDIEAPAT